MSSEKTIDAASIGQDGQSSPSNRPNSQYGSPIAIALAFVAPLLCTFLITIDLTIVATAIPKITDEFHSLDQVGLYGSAFFLTVAAFQSTWGKLYNYFDLKWTFMISIFSSLK
jgi:MFS family permease